MSKTYADCKKEVAKKHGFGKDLVMGHKAQYFDEAAEIYASQLKQEEWVSIEKDLPEETQIVFWCKVPVCEPPYAGSLLDVGFVITDYTHWRPISNDFFPNTK